MLTPAIGCILFVVAACVATALSPTQSSSNIETWPWLHRSHGPEVPFNATEYEETRTKNSRRAENKQNLGNLSSINPVIRIRVFAPNSTRQVLHSPVKIHVVSPEDSTKHRKRSHRPIVPPDDNFISRSSSVMEYDGYPMTLQKPPKDNSIEPKILRIPNELQGTDSFRDGGTSRTIYMSKDRPQKRKGKERKKNKGKKRKKDRKNKVKVRATFFEEMSNLAPRKVPPIGTTYVSLHSPRRIHVPVWGKGKRNGSMPVEISDKKQCFQCPADITYTADKRKSNVTLPVPSIAICRKHAMRRGRLNLAVLSGPSPGTVLSEGDYLTHLIGWKAGGPLYSCRYKVTVEVKRCPELSPKEGTEIECENGNVWGATCKFSCKSSDEALTGANTVVCVETDNKMEWSSSLPACGNKPGPEIVSTPKHRKPCKAPSEPPSGTIVCNSALEDGFYQSKTICRYLCFPGYEILPDSEDSLIVCNKGTWKPKVDVSCRAVHCPRLESPENGKIKCLDSSKDPSGNGGAPQGTTCSYSCNPGFVVPASQVNLKHIKCLAPEWNQTTAPECKQKIPPKPGSGQCKDQTLYISRDNVVTLSDPLFYVEHDNGTRTQIRNVSCTHKSGKLIVGKHANKCTAYDAELDVFGSCTYTIDVKEKSCKAPRNIQKSKLKCTYRKRPISNGNYFPGTLCEISCDKGYSFSQQLGNKVFSRCQSNLRWNRSWKLSCHKVVSASCPALEAIPNGTVTCRAKANGKTHSVSSVCSYVCDEDHVVPTSQLALVSRICLPTGQWNETKAPACVRSIPPQPEDNWCSNASLPVSLSLPISPPDFVAVDLRHIPSNCTEGSIDSNGLINVTCSAYDSELRVWGNCSFNINGTADALEPCDPAEPKVIVMDCADINVTQENASDFTLPDFTHLLNETVQTNCTEVNVTTIGIQNVTCIGFDPKTNNSVTCSFNFNVIDDSDPNSDFESSSTLESSPTTDTWTGTEPFDSTDDASESPDSTDDASESPDSTTFTEPSATIFGTTPDKIDNCTDDVPVVLEPGCVDQITESGFNFNVSYPEFITSRNTSAEVVCSPVDPDIHETQTVSCEAIDHETNASSSCEFKVTVADGNLRSHDVMEDITEAMTRDILSSLSQGLLDCPPLEAPSNGFINCSSPYECLVECNEGHKFPSSHSTLLQGELSCDKTTGFWNFDDDSLPDCLRALQTTSVEVWLGFNANVENCTFDEEQVESKIKQKLLELNNETCQLINCNVSLLLNCSEEDEEESNTTVVVTWNLRASYDPRDYKFNNKVPLAETQLESVLDKTKDAVLSDEGFKDELNDVGLQLMQNSFRRGRMILVCDERGFVVESETDRCVECAAGSIEAGGSCVPCPSQHYQDQNGQTECMPCPTNSPSEAKVPAGC